MFISLLRLDFFRFFNLLFIRWLVFCLFLFCLISFRFGHFYLFSVVTSSLKRLIKLLLHKLIKVLLVNDLLFLLANIKILFDSAHEVSTTKGLFSLRVSDVWGVLASDW